MRVVVIGCGRIGAHVARRLAGDGHAVCVIDQDRASLGRLGEGFSGETVVGPGFDREVLQSARVAEADAVVVLTNVDATNFMVAKAVTGLFGVQRVTVRVNDPEFQPIFDELGLRTIPVPDLVLDRVRDALAAGGPREGDADRRPR